jgi:TubC N-terminal docking domain
MQAAELLNELKARGVVLEVRGDRIRVGPRDSVPPEILADLRAHKSELMDLLTWPAECLEAEREHGHISARLYPLLGRPVSTPVGPALLVAALPERAVAIPDRHSGSFAVFLPSEIAPLNITPQGIRSEVH